MLKYRIPIPPFNEQIRIITILDKFDTLTNSISEGLPLEIELRKKQYEYYRDLLFSFPKPEGDRIMVAKAAGMATATITGAGDRIFKV
ncbi:restriction endonuclease subunit S [Salmonella enterica]|nr:restriction endonuclease subunit S [Salmonella enterica]